MTPESLIEKLESLDLLDAKVLERLRRTVANPNKASSVNKILSYLVKKDHLSKEQAVELKKNGGESPPPPAPSHQTDDLLTGVMDPDEVESPVDDDIGFVEEPEDEGAESEEEEVEEPQPAAPYIEPEPVVDEVIEEFTPPPVKELQSYEDPMTTPLDDLSSEAHPAVKSGKSSFSGKIDSRDQWATKWLFIGFATLGFLMVAGTLLFFFLSMISAVDRFDAAMKSFENGTYGDAIKKFDEFVKKHPSHEKAPLARVKRVQSLLADTFKQRNWDETIVRAEKNLPGLVEDDSIDLDPIRQDLAVMLPTSTLEIARRATKQETKSELTRELDKAKNAKKLVDNPVYIPNSKRKQATIAKILDSVEEEIAKGDGLIRKQDDYDSALVQIAAFREQAETDKAFATYNKLIRSYGDLRANEKLQQEMRQVSELESQLVEVIQPDIAPQSDFRNSPVKSSVVLASKTGSPIESLRGEIVPVLADGSVFGIDLGEGSVKWRRFVGYRSDIEPLKVDAANILISDQSNHDLTLVKANDGSVIWRSEIGESFLAPQVDEGIIFLTTDSGKLMRLDLVSGNVTAAVKIPQNASVPMVRSKRTGTVIQPGFYSNLYVLSEQDLTCKDVFYLGHNRGSISVPPVVWNNMILVAVNQSGVCDLNVLRPTEDGVNLELVQRIRRVTRGVVSNPMIRFGRFMLISSESGDLKILELNTAEETSPIRILAEEKFENRDGTRAFLETAGSQLWIGVNGMMRYKISRALATFERQKISNPGDFFTGPIRKIGDSIVHIRKRRGSALTSVSAVDSTTLEQIWRTDLGGPLAGPPIVSGSKLAAVSSQGDLFSITDSRSVVADEIAKSSSAAENLLFDQMFELTPTTRVFLGPVDRAEMLFVDIEQGSSKLLRLPPPADKAACRAITVGGDLIVPSRQGQVVRIDPRNGNVTGTPFLPPVKPGTDIKWTTPALVGGGYFVIGAGQNLFLIDATDRKVLKKIGDLAIDGSVKSPITAVNGKAFTIVGGKPTDQLISVVTGNDGLQPSQSVDLGGLSIAGPWVIDNYLMLRMENNQLVCFDHGLKRKWEAELGAGEFATAPSMKGNGIQLVFGNGRLVVLNAETGNIETDASFGQPVVHQPVELNNQTFFAGRDGTVNNAVLSSDGR